MEKGKKRSKLKILAWYELIASFLVVLLTIASFLSIYANDTSSTPLWYLKGFVAILGLSGAILILKGKNFGLYLSIIWSFLQLFYIETSKTLFELTQILTIFIAVNLESVTVKYNVLAIILLGLFILWRKDIQNINKDKLSFKAKLIISILGVILLVGAVLSGLFINAPSEEAIKNSLEDLDKNYTTTVDTFYSHLNDEDYEYLLKMLHEDIYSEGQVKTEEQAINVFKYFNAVYGKEQSHSLLRWDLTKFGPDLIGDDEKITTHDTFLEYSVNRTEGEYIETFLITKYSNSDKYWIKSYNVELKQ